MSVKQSLVLDGGKAAAALKSHSEAERRRRDRINTHLDTLRGLLPIADKMDKATLLAEVVTELKQLKTSARQASEEMNIPMDTDEVKVDEFEDKANGHVVLKASICCVYQPDLFSNMKEAMSDLPVKLLRPEICTLGNRVKIVFLLTTLDNISTAETHILSSVRAALSKVLDKVSAATEFAQPLVYPQKRQRIS